MVLSTRCTSSTGMLILRGPWPEPQRRKKPPRFYERKVPGWDFHVCAAIFCCTDERARVSQVGALPRQLGSLGLPFFSPVRWMLASWLGAVDAHFPLFLSFSLFFFSSLLESVYIIGEGGRKQMARRFINRSGRGDLGKGPRRATAWTSMRPLHDQFWGDNLFFLAACDLSPIFGFHNLDI